MGLSEMRPSYDCHLTGRQIQERNCEKDIEVDVNTCLLLENHTRIVTEVDHIPMNVKVTFKHMEIEMFNNF